MPKSRPPYPEEFRREAVQLVRSGRTIKDVAGSLGVTEPSLRTWVKHDQLERQERDDGLTLAEREQLRRLRREHKRLEQEPICSNEPRPSSRGRPRPGECLPDHLSGEGQRNPGLPGMRAARRLTFGLIWGRGCQGLAGGWVSARSEGSAEGAAGLAVARRVVRLIFAGWVPQDQVSS